MYINKGGGKILLDILISKLLQNKVQVFFLLDKRLENAYPSLTKNVLYLEASLLKRHIFYIRNKKKFNTVLAFGNIPPTILMRGNVYTYFHNVHFLSASLKPGLSNLKLYLKSLVLKIFKSKTDFWIVQNDLVKTGLVNSFKIAENCVKILPIYDDSQRSSLKKDYDTNAVKFLYVSTGEAHKNHFRLINAFVRLNKIKPSYSLTITVGEEYADICEYVKMLNSTGISIINRGFLSKIELQNEYEIADVFIFPSLKESFGLGLVEAALCQLPILASNLEFVNEVIIPSGVFNPYSEDDIFDVMHSFKKYINKKALIKTSNQVNELLSILKSGEINKNENK
jgi:glycosyltransferase involved in cell wall biosynthesis